MQTSRADKTLLLMTFILAVFGLVMITSIGVPKSIQLSAPDILYPNCSAPEVDCYLLFKNHLVRLIIGGIGLFITSKIPYRLWKKASVILFAATVFVLFLVLIIGSKYTTFATSWFQIFNTSIQPIEFAKLGVIFYLATWMERKKSVIGNFQEGFLPFCIVSGVVILPVILQPDLGGTFVMGSIAVTMFFVAGAKIRHLALGALIAVLISTIVIFNMDYLRNRFQAFLGLSQNCSESYCWQSEQANIAVGSGGFFGKGLTQGVQKSYWLPQASDDFIFAASAEELGFIRIGLLVIVYSVIAYRGFKIANGAPTNFAMLTAVGITSWITIQAFTNIAVNIGLFPVTGITLPLVSYGGSSLLSTMIGIGILLNISKQSSYATDTLRRGNRRSYNPKRGYYRGT